MRANTYVITSMILFSQVTACATPQSPTAILPSATGTVLSRPTNTVAPTKTATLVPSNTPDLELARQTATWFDQDFESGTALGVFDVYGDWSVSVDGAGNHVFCNEFSEEWQSFKFGLKTWTDYAVEARVKILEGSVSRNAEVYSRVNSSTDGYRASLADGSAALAYFPPYKALGTGPFTARENRWYELRVEAAGDRLRFFVDDRLVASGKDSQHLSGMAGLGASPGTMMCVDDIRLWALMKNGEIVRTSPLEKYEECEFCFLDDEGPSAPVWDAAARGMTYPRGDPREIITIDEDFRVHPGEHVVFDSKIVLVKPTRRKDIEIYGTLIVRDSIMIWLQTEDQQTRLRVMDGGSLVIRDSYAFSGNQYWLNWDFEDGSSIEFDHFVGDPWTSLRGSVNYTSINYSTVKLTLFGDTHDAHINISDAHELWLELFPSEGTHVITFPARGQWVDWTLAELWHNTAVVVEDSYLYNRDVALNNNTHVTVKDTPSGFGLGWTVHKDRAGFINCELRNLGEPGAAGGTFYADSTWDLPCNNSSLTIHDSRLLGSWPNNYGYVHLRVFVSNLVDPRNFGAPATLEIFDSTVDVIAAYRGGRVYIENSLVRQFLEAFDPGSIVYGYGVRGPYELLESGGGAYIELHEPRPPWR